ncbi:MAG TPA: hypothetical protein VHB48_04775, partial [Chitinophagaceae bacterium]|nr:hypothetical protein [Chitinophagaceae bacterium]
FTPHPTEGSKSPKFNNRLCYGWNLNELPPTGKVDIHWIIQAYKMFKNKDSFFTAPKILQPSKYYFNLLAGNGELMRQIKQGKTEEEIRNSWQPKLKAFKKIRKKYLLYPDFE